MRNFILPLLLSLCLAGLTGCSEKDPKKITDTVEVNRWVYDQMLGAYLWANRLPENNASELTADTEDFFESLLYDRGNTYGDRFSYIEPTSPATRASSGEEWGFGLRTMSYYASGSLGITYTEILYVAENSPGDAAGLERGDIITRMNGERPTVTNLQTYLDLYTVLLTVEGKGDVFMTRALVNDNPVIYTEVFNREDDPQELAGVAYLVYNHFTGSRTCTEDLYDFFGRCRAGEVTDLILDFRYNGGGEIANAQQLGTLIVKNGSLGEVFYYTENNAGTFKSGRFTSSDRSHNADIQRLYILTSKTHTASASELIIHCLKPFYGDDLHVIGGTTVGKNVGSYDITSPSYDWKLVPISMRVHDNKHESGYEEGIRPDPGMVVAEVSGSLYPFGDRDRDPLLNKVLTTYFGYTIPAPDTETQDRSRAAGGESLLFIDSHPGRGMTMPPPEDL